LGETAGSGKVEESRLTPSRDTVLHPVLVIFSKKFGVSRKREGKNGILRIKEKEKYSRGALGGGRVARCAVYVRLDWPKETPKRKTCCKKEGASRREKLKLVGTAGSKNRQGDMGAGANDMNNRRKLKGNGVL